METYVRHAYYYLSPNTPPDYFRLGTHSDIIKVNPFGLWKYVLVKMMIIKLL